MMQIEVKEQNGFSCALVNSDVIVISDGQSALDFMMTVQQETSCDRVSLNKEAIADSFFVLSSGLAGAILQKFVNYHFKFAIVGDFSSYTSKSFKDFIYECNRGNAIFFVATEEQAVAKLKSAISL